MGTRIDVRHLAATPVGMRATIRATLREVDGRRLVFDIEGHDEVERIVEGTHERFQIDPARFLARIAAEEAADLDGSDERLAGIRRGWRR